MNILALLQCIQPAISGTNVKRLRRIVTAMIAMTGRVTMLGISRWTGKGGSYRTIQRFFNAIIPWSLVFKLFFETHLSNGESEHFLVGDECVVTKSGKETHGIDHFFSGLMNKVVKGLAIFTLAVVDVNERHSYPLSIEQVIRSEAEKEAAKTKQKAKTKKDPHAPKKKPGRPKGSQNRDKTLVDLTLELKRIQNMVQKQLEMLQGVLTIRHLALDGHFGNNNALQMVLQCGLHLISKLRCDSALYFRYDGLQKKKGPRKKYGQKIDYGNIPNKYLVQKSTDGDLETHVYQAEMLHKEFAQPLNVVIITKTNLKTGVCANVNLFSSDLQLAGEKIIDYYALRFQIEFNFRDAKQYWGLEDFMNTKEVPLTNALNLSLFMVNVSQVLLREFRQTNPDSGVLDLKAYFRAAKYFEETIKLLPKKPEPILLDQIFAQVASLGCIHPVNVPISSP
jgi:putative transposase